MKYSLACSFAFDSRDGLLGAVLWSGDSVGLAMGRRGITGLSLVDIVRWQRHRKRATVGPLTSNLRECAAVFICLG